MLWSILQTALEIREHGHPFCGWNQGHHLGQRHSRELRSLPDLLVPGPHSAPGPTLAFLPAVGSEPKSHPLLCPDKTLYLVHPGRFPGSPVVHPPGVNWEQLCTRLHPLGVPKREQSVDHRRLRTREPQEEMTREKAMGAGSSHTLASYLPTGQLSGPGLLFSSPRPSCPNPWGGLGLSVGRVRELLSFPETSVDRAWGTDGPGFLSCPSCS